MDKVSIVIPVYNGEKYLDKCIQHLIGQTYKYIEIIFINDGSTDNTLEILKKYQKKDDRIIIIDKENTGVADSRNKGILKASGKYICFCDADDMYEDNYVQSMLDLIKENDADAVRCNYKLIENNKTILGNTKNKIYFEKDIREKIIPKFLNGSLPCFSVLLFIKKDKIKTFPTDISMMEDVVFYIDLFASIKKVFFTDKVLYNIIVNKEGATNNIKNTERNILDTLKVNTKVKEILEKNSLLNKENIQHLNINSLNATADFIFKNYLYGQNTIKLCKKIRNENFLEITSEIDLSKIDFARRKILQLIKNENYIRLKIYFCLRKLFFKLKRRHG